MKVQFKKLSDRATIPSYANLGDSGLDLHPETPFTLEPGERKLIKTGIAIELPQGYEAQVRPRSGLALKYGVTVLNSPGTIDSSYRGDIGVILINHGEEEFEYFGKAIAQLVIAPVTQVDLVEAQTSLTMTKRGEGGFGSTDDSK